MSILMFHVTSETEEVLKDSKINTRRKTIKISAIKTAKNFGIENDVFDPYIVLKKYKLQRFRPEQC